MIAYTVICHHWLNHKLILVRYHLDQACYGGRCLQGKYSIFLLVLRFV